MVFEVNSIDVLPERAAEFEAAFAAVAKLLGQVPGCRSARLLRCVERPGRYLVQVEWARLEDHEQVYPATPQSAEIRRLLLPLIANAERGHFEPIKPG